MMKKPQLFLLHFAGGSCYSYPEMTPFLVKDFQVIPLELPGRGRRLGEKLIRDYDAAALDLHSQIVKRLNAPRFLIYGHSLGAYMGLTIAGMLEREGKAPSGLIVSGNAGPGIRENKKRHVLGYDAFAQELLDMGGATQEFVADRDLFGFFEPILRADFEIIEKEEIKLEPAIGAPLFAIMGSEEKNVEQIGNWSRFTRSAFHHEILTGGHFFIHQHPRKMADIIRHCYHANLIRHT